jgi:hypothetical protein
MDCSFFYYDQHTLIFFRSVSFFIAVCQNAFSSSTQADMNWQLHTYICVYLPMFSLFVHYLTRSEKLNYLSKEVPSMYT